MSQTSSESQSLITPTFVFAWLVNFAQFSVFYLLVTIMALYAVEQFQASDTAGGFASSAFVVGATIARLFSGYIVDAAGRKRSLVVSLIVVTVAMALYFPAQSLPLLFAVRILHGFGYAVASTAVMAVAQSVIPDHRRAEGTGYFALGTTLATAFGPAAGLAIVHNAGYNTVFLVALTLTVVAMGLGLIVKAPAQERRSVSFSLGNIVHPAVAPFGVFILLVGVAYTGIITFLNGYSAQAGLEKGASYFFLAYAVVSLILRFVLGKLQDRRGDNIIIYSSLVFFIAGLAVLASAVADWQIIAAGALVGIGYGSILPAGQAIAVRLVPMHEMGAGISTFFLLLDLGIGFGPILLGQVISATGYSAMYWMLAALLLVASVVYFSVHGRKDIARGDVRYE
ncbi:MFS transporter [Corynebacterium aurimucosum]|uniref:Permease of the major facilitator superfamily n=1 Tax=Corynebacterium aurimucosum (strain ATCC 700975 / DSM 44827 / CIP 107346 / CN-1) TaxID=548476 RepID=C3PFE8_CORA7|nr:MFS transporter [Corynebacterium aurimucosum]ACP32552.1 permease of the major facilitator superfamily [Corynebacterium aurimucosum ATCC 700975]QQU93272.1 MFS transporter [Corynebacterium aurimucosum]